MRRIFVLPLLLIFVIPARASPPLPGSEDDERLTPYAAWLSKQAANGGGLCCSIADCRVVRWRISAGAYEAFIPQRDDRGFVKFPYGPNTWIKVPTEVIKREINPTGQAIACWSHDHLKDRGYYCFFLPDLT